MRWMILALAIAVAGCSEGDRFAADYEKAEKDPKLTGKDMCAAAKLAAEAYAREHEIEKASKWRSKAQTACMWAG